MEQKKTGSVEDAMDVAALALSWSSHCQSMAEKTMRRANQAIEPVDGQKPSILLAHESESWMGMGKNSLAQSIYAMDLTQGERAMVRSISAPDMVRRLMLAQGYGQVGMRRFERLECLAKSLRAEILSGSGKASELFSEGEIGAQAQMMRKGRVAHLGLMFGSVPVLGVGMMGQHLSSQGVSPAFLAMVAAGALALAASSLSSVFGKSPDALAAAKLLRLAYPQVSKEDAQALIANDLRGDSVRVALSQDDRPRAVSGPMEAQAWQAIGDAFAQKRSAELFDGAPSLANGQQALVEYCAPVEAAIERTRISEFIGTAPARPRKTRSI